MGPLTEQGSTPLLDTVREPADIRGFTAEQLKSVGVPSLMNAVTVMHRPTSVADAERGRRRKEREEGEGEEKSRSGHQR